MGPDMFARGWLIGFAIAAPVGPIGVLCIRRTLAYGRRVGLATGLGAATADACYGAVAAFGLTAVSRLLLHEGRWIRLIGGLFLCCLGVKTLLSAPAGHAAVAQGQTIVRAYSSAVALTLTNPTTIVSFGAVFAGLGVGTSGGPAGLALFVVWGVLMGSASWWVILSGGVSMARGRVTPGVLRGVNYVSGGILTAFGLLALAGLR